MQVIRQAGFVNTTTEPVLAPPGAGLPPLELTIARLLFAWRLRTGRFTSFDASFQRERELIRTATRGLSQEIAARRVLIPRLPGMEDSSRHWSVWMTLDHLRIVHRSIARVIASLSNGVVPEGRASTAAVKPSPDAGAGVAEEYERSCDELRSRAEAIRNLGGARLKLAPRYPHPWFGPLTASGWHALAAGHLGIHRRQIQRIVQELGKAGIVLPATAD